MRIERDFFVIPNDVIDVLAPLQTPAEEVVYRRLFRMSYGWRRNFCSTSIPRLLKTMNIQSRNTVRKALRGLIEKGHIAEYINERINRNASIIWGAYIDPELKGAIRVMLVLVGVTSEQISGKSVGKFGDKDKGYTRREERFGVQFIR